MAVPKNKSKEVKWHYGLPERGEVIILVYFIDSLEEWTSRIVKVNSEILNIIECSQDSPRPCRWIFADEDVTDWEKMTPSERSELLDKEQ